MSAKPDYKDPEEVDAAWLDAEAELRSAVHQQFRKLAAEERRTAREAMSLDDRRKDVIVSISRLFTNSASSIGRVSRGANSVHLPSGGDQLEVGHVHKDELARVIRLAFDASDVVAKAAIERLELLLDQHLGIGEIIHVFDIGAENDRRILALHKDGLTASQIARLEPLLGDTLYVQRILEHDKAVRNGTA